MHLLSKPGTHEQPRPAVSVCMLYQLNCRQSSQRGNWSEGLTETDMSRSHNTQQWARLEKCRMCVYCIRLRERDIPPSMDFHPSFVIERCLFPQKGSISFPQIHLLKDVPQIEGVDNWVTKKRSWIREDLRYFAKNILCTSLFSVPLLTDPVTHMPWLLGN